MALEKRNWSDDEVRRRGILIEELRQMASAPLPSVQPTWNVVWVLSGPEGTFDEAPKDKTSYNQTRLRFETAVSVAKAVARTRLNYQQEESLSSTMYEFAAPFIYFNGTDTGVAQIHKGNGVLEERLLQPMHNSVLRRVIESGEFVERFAFPPSRVLITKNREITNTGHQFADFPVNFIPRDNDEAKLVIVSDAYHLVRVQHMLKSKKWRDKFPPDSYVLYPAQPTELPFHPIRREVRKLVKDYVQEGIIDAF